MLTAKQVIGMFGAVGLSATGALAQASWVPFGSFNEGAVWDLHVHNGELYLAGRNGNVGTGLGAFVRKWNGTEWVWVGNQLLVEQPGAVATQLASHNGELYVVGLFSDGMLQQAARWDGSAWRAVGDGLGTFGRDVESFAGRLWAIRAFTQAPGDTTYSLRVLEGQQWVEPASGAVAGAYSLHVVDGEFYVGTRGGEVLRYEQGAFISLGQVAPGNVSVITEHQGELHVGLSPSANVIYPVWRQVDGRWRPLPLNLVSGPTFIASMSSFDDELHVFGHMMPLGLRFPNTQFASAGTRWSPGPTMHTLNVDAVRSSIVWEGALLVGAEFAGSPATVYRYAGAPDPTLSVAPVSQPLECSGAARAAGVTVTSPSSVIVFQENMDTGAIVAVNPGLPNGSPARFDVPQPANRNGTFRFVVVSPSGRTVSDTFTVRGIDIDFNNNGVFPEDQDVIDFFSTLAGGVCVGATFVTCDSIDVNVNGIYPEDADVVAFFTNLAGGCE